MRHADVLRLVVKKYNVEIMAEIGVWWGKLFRGILRSEEGKKIREYRAIDPWSSVIGRDHGHMSEMTPAKWNEMYNYCKSYESKYLKVLKIMRMTSLEASLYFKSHNIYKYFDFVYLDASHFFIDVQNDIGWWISLVKDGGIIGGHDYDRGHNKGHKVKEAVLTYFKEEDLEFYSGGTWIKRID